MNLSENMTFEELKEVLGSTGEQCALISDSRRNEGDLVNGIFFEAKSKAIADVVVKFDDISKEEDKVEPQSLRKILQNVSSLIERPASDAGAFEKASYDGAMQGCEDASQMICWYAVGMAN
ncbi:hypothetical protein QYZ88_012395 [Lachnospiraceae bacterium C1.1]|nr:hypothetical protein [Lachnospiraceae bacterium C1.1]